MAWISVHDGMIDHPKTRRFAWTLKCDRHRAAGLLLALWQWGMHNTDQDGVIQYASAQDIADGMMYKPSPEISPGLSPDLSPGLSPGMSPGMSPETTEQNTLKNPAQFLVDALVQSKWLDVGHDGSYIIHDWDEWQSEWFKYVNKKNAEKLKKRAQRAKAKAMANVSAPDILTGDTMSPVLSEGTSPEMSPGLSPDLSPGQSSGPSPGKSSLTKPNLTIEEQQDTGLLVNSIKEQDGGGSPARTRAREGAAAAAPPPPPVFGDSIKKYGKYSWVKLTDAEYSQLADEFGAGELERHIAIVDEKAQEKGNKQGWKDWALIVRKAINQRWSLDYPAPGAPTGSGPGHGNNKNQSPGNRANFGQREYSEKYLDTFVSNEFGMPGSGGDGETADKAMKNTADGVAVEAIDSS